MKCSGHVYAVVISDSGLRSKFADEAWPGLHAMRKDRVDIGGHKCTLGRFRDADGGLEGQAAVLFKIHRQALLERPDGSIEPENQDEWEQVEFLLLKSGYVVVRSPDLSTRVTSPAEARAIVRAFLEARLGKLFPGIRLVEPSRERGPKEFVKWVHQAASLEEVRLIEVQVRDLAAGVKRDDLSFYNPIPDKNAGFLMYWDDIASDLGTVTFKAASGGDLSHNPAVRGSVDQGRPSKVIIERPVRGTKRMIRRVLRDKQKPVLDYQIAEKGLPIEEELDAIQAALEAGDFDVEIPDLAATPTKK